MPTITDYTKVIHDSVTSRAVYDLAYQITEGNFTPKISGTAITSSADELNKLDGVSVTAAEMDYRALTVVMENVSSAKAVYAVCPYTGNLSKIYVVLGGTTLAPTPDKFSFGVNAVNLSGNIITITTGTTVATGSSVTPTATAKAITAGQVIRFSCNGGSTGPAMNAVFTVLVDIT